MNTIDGCDGVAWCDQAGDNNQPRQAPVWRIIGDPRVIAMLGIASQRSIALPHPRHASLPRR
ncbi:hypothetical protein LL965_01180 [Xanthomonas cassavae CFBP 4642]|uniref:Uncharacterized protein n=1 Tax=Xanthomonas cassavae CFBP 4642 TaxID=1219375 RepID=A0ABS8HBN8_9XANT|nr:hypothetical protein [Xanthomonas cassavae]MCC4618756.1 hypothetical protein [Xanthomonas cassavae CFBP 4642]